MKSLRMVTGFGAFLLVMTLSSTAFSYNFIYSCGATWTNVPVNYYVNQNGSSSLGFNTVLSTFENSFNAWAAPCCSSYRANYAGTTTETATNTQRNVVLSFKTGSWDPQFGGVNSTIGVTLTRVRSDCTIYNAPILFNEVGFRFRTDGRATDLESIATHEIGHHLGLGHETRASGRLPTMYPSYDGSTGFRSLEPDDINGVCALYPGGSCACVSTSDCVGDFVCIDRVCQTPPCGSNADCPEGQVCGATGDCAPQRCSTDSECQAGFACTSGICERCSVCERCNSNNDCGANGVCVQGGLCLTYCGENGSCPGSTVCVDGGGAFVCVNPDYQSAGFCPSNFSCTDGSVVNECNFNADCPPGQECVDEGGVGKCQPAADPCFRIFCEAGSVCVQGNCVDDGSTGNNTTGNNSSGNNTTANNNVGGTNNNTSGSTDDEIIIIGNPNATSGGNSDDSCSAAGGGMTGPFGIFLLIGFVLRRRRRV